MKEYEDLMLLCGRYIHDNIPKEQFEGSLWNYYDDKLEVDVVISNDEWCRDVQYCSVDDLIDLTIVVDLKENKVYCETDAFKRKLNQVPKWQHRYIFRDFILSVTDLIQRKPKPPKQKFKPTKKKNNSVKKKKTIDKE